MIDKNTQLLLKTITSQIADESYKVIDKDEFLAKFNKKQGVDEQMLSTMMHHLQKNNYIDIKYSDSQVYCLAVKPKAREVEQPESDSKQVSKKLKKMLFFYVILSGASAFLGTAAAIYLFLR